MKTTIHAHLHALPEGGLDLDVDPLPGGVFPAQGLLHRLDVTGAVVGEADVEPVVGGRDGEHGGSRDLLAVVDALHLAEPGGGPGDAHVLPGAEAVGEHVRLSSFELEARGAVLDQHFRALLLFRDDEAGKRSRDECTRRWRRRFERATQKMRDSNARVRVMPRQDRAPLFFLRVRFVFDMLTADGFDFARLSWQDLFCIT